MAKMLKQNSKIIFVVCLWTLALLAGFWKLLTYANTPGEAAHVQAHWPANTKLVAESGKASLVIFAHPRCPCSEASVGELERLAPHLAGKTKNYVVFVKPDGTEDDWANESLWQRAKAIPGVEVVLDSSGIQAKLFDAKTSGQTFLYDANGNLVFSGGITPARGHMGDNLGRDAILSFLETGKTDIHTTSAFGCTLMSPERALAGGTNDTAP